MNRKSHTLKEKAPVLQNTVNKKCTISIAKTINLVSHNHDFLSQTVVLFLCDQIEPIVKSFALK